MIVVDTSVWVTALRTAGSAEALALTQLIDADEVLLTVPVRSEIFGGASAKNRAVLRRTMSALPVAYPDDGTWRTIDEWIDRASQAGQRFGVGDLLIAAIAHENGALVWSLDGDFDRMSRLGFVQLYG